MVGLLELISLVHETIIYFFFHQLRGQGPQLMSFNSFFLSKIVTFIGNVSTYP